jgi:hypothetical protein
MNSTHSKAFIGVHRPERPGTLIFVIIDDRAAFDLIDLPEGGNEKVRHKAIDDGKSHVIFQYWLDGSVSCHGRPLPGKSFRSQNRFDQFSLGIAEFPSASHALLLPAFPHQENSYVGSTSIYETGSSTSMRGQTWRIGMECHAATTSR